MELELIWKPEYLVGDTDIDAQHQQLFETANAILASHDRTHTSKLLFQLFRYTREHFSLEEALMQKRGYMGLKAHRDQHNNLIEKLSTVIAHAGLDDQSFHNEVYGLMKDWLLVHIMDYDMRIPKE